MKFAEWHATQKQQNRQTHIIDSVQSCESVEVSVDYSSNQDENNLPIAEPINNYTFEAPTLIQERPKTEQFIKKLNLTKYSQPTNPNIDQPSFQLTNPDEPSYDNRPPHSVSIILPTLQDPQSANIRPSSFQ